MFTKRLLIVLTTVAVALFSVTICYAEEDTVLYQAYAWEQNIDIYIAGNMIPDSLSCKVSNQAAEIVDSGLLVNRDVTTRTTILLDISASIPSQVRENIRLFIDTLIQNMLQNEQYKIVIFGEQLTVLQDYTSDRNDLSSAVEKIAYNGQQSKIYDAIYNTIPQVQPIGDLPCYYRTIVITDGVDDTASGITREELYLKLQADTYPIDIVAVSKAEQTEPEKQLSALTRISSGRYVNLYPESDLATLMANLTVSDVFWIRAIIPRTLLDGAIRQINLSDGISSLQFDTKIPVFNVPVVEASAPTEESPTETPSPMPSAIPITDVPTALIQPRTPTTIVIFIGAGIGLVIVTAIIIAIIVKKRKKKPKYENAFSVNNNPTISKGTEILGADSSNSSHGALCIRLRDINNPDQIWNTVLSNTIIIGRDANCQICITDSSVSRQQCKLYLINNVPMVENMSQSNITQLNGEHLSTPRPIKEGDKINCGRVTLMVDSLYGSDSGNVENLNNMTGFLNV